MLAKPKLYRIGELAKNCGVSPRTIDYYTTMGLIAPSVRTEGNFRLYDESMVERLEWIKKMREQKFSLDEIKERINVIYGEVNEAVLSKQLDTVIKEVEHLQKDLTSLTPLLNKLKQNGVGDVLKGKLEQLMGQEQSLIQAITTILERVGGG